tara:strand:+ start:162 stop:548 length:387 start_codon:yes stop_codon:yes gene_type:complete
MKDKVNKILSSREWTFADLANMSELVKQFSEEIYNELNAKEKLELVWNLDVADDEHHFMKFGNYFNILVLEQIQIQVASILQEQLLTANVNFNENKEDETNEVSESSLDGEPPKRGKTVSKNRNKDKK